jgi:hypothetical protein
VQFGGLQLAVVRNDPPVAVVAQDNEDRIAILGEPLNAVMLAPVGPSQPQAKDAMLASAWTPRPLQSWFHARLLQVHDVTFRIQNPDY